MDPDGETSNHLFSILADWNKQLSRCELYKNPQELPFQELNVDEAFSASNADDAGETRHERSGGGS